MGFQQSKFERGDSEHVAPKLCVNLCEVAPAGVTPKDIEELVVQTCWRAGFPYCERIYVGSYFCENYFLHSKWSFHQAVREACNRLDLDATLVVPVFGQAFLERGERHLAQVLTEFRDVYDEVIVNDVAEFHALGQWFAGGNVGDSFGARPVPAEAEPRAEAHEAETEAERAQATAPPAPAASTAPAAVPEMATPPAPRLGLGRLFSKELRDARYGDAFYTTARPGLSAEAQACLKEQSRRAPFARPLVEMDPTAQVVDASDLVTGVQSARGEDGSFPEIAIHLPYCYATTGRNCGPASYDEPETQKFRLGQGCSQHCLRMDQGCLTDEGARYLKHGRAYYFENPACLISGVDTWRIVYAAAL